jgi:uncharacterized protein YggT (Ycf19 family)
VLDGRRGSDRCRAHRPPGRFHHDLHHDRRYGGHITDLTAPPTERLVEATKERPMSTVADPQYAPQPAPEPPMEKPTHLWLVRAAKGFVVFIYAVVLIDLVMLLLGFFLRLFGASTDAEFTRWVYRSVERIMEPFRGMFPTIEGSGESVLDVSLLFAMIVYTLVAIALHCLVVWLTDKIVALRRREQAAAYRRPPSAAVYAPMPRVPGTPAPDAHGPSHPPAAQW